MTKFSFSILISFVLLTNLQAQWKPADSPMFTEWGRGVTPEKVWSEHPRPQLQRRQWVNLNGLWDVVIAGNADNEVSSWWQQEGTRATSVSPPLNILVPFCLEAPLSGVGKALEPNQALWYRRELPVKPMKGKRTILHFDAVDYDSTVWVNGKEIGRHVGGYTPFSFDITDALKESGNILKLKVLDATEGYQVRGKQCLRPHGIWGSRVSGIWQTVWLEEVPERFLADLDFETAVEEVEKSEGVKEMKVFLIVRPKLDGTAVVGEKVKVSVSFKGKDITSSTGKDKLAIEISEPQWWTPEQPNLYDLKVNVLDGKGKALDTVTSYSALRQVGKARDLNGNLRTTLNGKPVFLFGPLDQGWWPDGLLTPPSDAAMVFDLEFLKSAGFNMLRKHVKVENSRYYYHCDRLGIAVWQDQANAGMWDKDPPAGITPKWTRLAPEPQDAAWPEDAHQQWVTEYKAMVDHLRDHPSVLIWCPFNESWGQHRSMEIGQMAVEYDPSRLVCIASGGNFWPVGDIASEHHYPEPSFPLGDSRFKDFIKVVGEMGGHGWPVEGHVFSKESAWGYGGLPKSLEEWKIRYERSVNQLVNLRHRGVSAAVYTQTAEFWTEVNGLMTFDRQPKADATWFRQVNSKVMTMQDEMTATRILPADRNRKVRDSNKPEPER